MAGTPRGIRAGVRRLFRLPLRHAALVRDDADLELHAFIQARIDHLVSRGMTLDQARAEALRRLGTTVDDAQLLLRRSATRRETHMTLLERCIDLLQDVKYAARGLRAHPTFTVAVVVTLGLGVGANAAMFGIVDRLLFRPPAYLRDAAAVNRVYFGRTFDGVESITSNFQYKRYLELRDWTRSFDRTAAFFGNQIAVGAGEDARLRLVDGVSASFFNFFDARPERGRFFTSLEDSVTVGAPVAVLGYEYWRTRFGGRDAVLGQTVRVGSLPFIVIGVAPAAFVGMEMESPAVFIPITAMGQMMGGGRSPTMYYTTYNMSWMEMLVHRRPGISAAAASVDISTAFRRSYAAQRETNPRMLPLEMVKPRAIVAPVLAERGPRQGSDSKVATWLIGVTAIVLLVACANVANLLLARAFGRRREIAVRLALGASRLRLVRQLLTESMLLAVLGGALGLIVAQAGGVALRALFLPRTAWPGAIADGRTVAFTALVAMLAGMLAGLAPVLHTRRGDVANSLKSGVREGTYHRSLLRAGLMVAQGALSVLLLVGAGLFVRSLQNVHHVRLGYDPEQLIFFQPNMRSTQLDTDGLAALKRRLVERAASLPKVERATRAVTVPFWQTIDFDLVVPGVDSAGRFGDFDLQAASPEYFATMGTRLLRGRGIEPTDVAGSPLVMVVSDAMAKALWPSQDALGKCVKLNADTMPCRSVVGITEEIRGSNIAGDERTFHYYLPIEQWERGNGGLFVRTRGDANRQVESVRRELQALMPGDSYLSARPMTEIMDPVVRSWRLGATLFVAFGGLALVLASIGLYSVIAYNVAQRTHELGVRVALGARDRDVLRLVLGQGLRLAAAGVVIGALSALWAGSFVKPLLFSVSPRDPVIFAIVSASLLGAALLASLVPAMRATSVDPISALRSD